MNLEKTSVIASVISFLSCTVELYISGANPELLLEGAPIPGGAYQIF